MSEFSTVLTEKRCSRTAIKVLDNCAECSTVVTNNWNHVNQSSVLNYSFWDVATCLDMNAVWSILGLKWLKETQKMIFQEFRNIQKTLSESSFLVMLPVQCCKYIFFLSKHDVWHVHCPCRASCVFGRHVVYGVLDTHCCAHTQCLVFLLALVTPQSICKHWKGFVRMRSRTPTHILDEILCNNSSCYKELHIR